MKYRAVQCSTVQCNAVQCSSKKGGCSLYRVWLVQAPCTNATRGNSSLPPSLHLQLHSSFLILQNGNHSFFPTSNRATLQSSRILAIMPAEATPPSLSQASKTHPPDLHTLHLGFLFYFIVVNARKGTSDSGNQIMRPLYNTYVCKILL